MDNDNGNQIKTVSGNRLVAMGIFPNILNEICAGHAANSSNC